MPDTFSYYVAAYVVAFLLCAGYVGSLVMRARRVPRAEGREPGAEDSR
jgi:hypothetical protein